MSRPPEPSGPPASADADLFAGGGELGRRMAAHDWSATPVGPPSGWPQSLRIAVRILLTSRYAMWLGWGPDFTFYYNDAYARMTLGPKHPWALGRPAKEVWAEIWGDIGPRAEHVVRTGEATWDEGLLLFLERNGYPEETYHTFSYSPLPDDAGGVGGMLCVVTEDTDRTIGERRLKTLRELAARTATESRTAEDACRAAAAVLADNPRDLPFALIYLLDPDGQSARLAGATGLPDGSPARPPVVPLAAAGPPAWPFPDVLAAGRAVEVDGLAGRFGRLPAAVWPVPPGTAVVLPVPAPGQDRPAGFVVAGASPRRPLDDAYRGFLDLVAGQVGTAVASARAFEDQRRRAEALAEVDRAKTAFFSNVSHEFRTPLTLMLGPVDELLKADGDVLAAGRADLEVVRRNGRRLRKLVNTLLDFSRIEAGRTRARFAPTDLAALTADLASNFRSACEAAGLRLVVDCPPLAHPVHVDPEMWEKVVLNLLSNAFKFTHAGEIRVAVRADGGRAVLSVADTGTGIPPADLPRVFDRFHRVEGSRGRTHEGTGIGLALVRELVHLHGGEVGVESTVGRGTTFTAAVPVGTAHLPADQLADVPAPGGSGADAFVEEAEGWLPSERGTRNAERGMEDRAGSSDSASRVPRSALPRVLLADDNADMRGYVRRLLAGRYAVEAVADGRAALGAAKARRPDLVVTDVMMPRLDGYGLLAALRADPMTADLPVVLLSARAGEEARVEGLRAGADDYLVKPFSAGELLARVDGLVALAAARRESAARQAETVGVLESITEGFAALDRDWRIAYFNAAAERLNGVRREDLLGKTHWEVYPATVGTELERHYRRAMADRVAVRFENHYAPWDRWFEVNLHPMTNGGLAVYWRDVTESKRAAAALRQTDERLALLVGHATDYAIILADPDGNVTEWLAGAERITGWTAAEAVGRPGSLIFTPEDRAAGVPDQEAATAASTGRAEDKRWHLKKDGTRFFADGMTTALRDEAGGLRGFGKVFRDATAAKLADERLRDSEALFRELADTAPAITWTTDPDGQCTYLSRGWYETTGQTPAEGLGLGWAGASHPDDRDRAGRAFLAASAARRPFLCDFRLRQADGSYRWAVDAGRPRFGPDGAFLGFVGNVFDVHDRRAAEEQYRTLLNSIDQGFCVIDLIDDPAGRVADYRFLEANPVFERQAGVATPPVGRTIRELVPGIEAHWFERYGRVAATGEPARFTERSDALGRWFEVDATRVGGPGSRRVAVLFTDITARVRAEAAVAAAAARDAFRVRLADALRPLSDPLEVQAAAGRVLGEQFGASRVLYFEIRGDEYVVDRDYARGVASLVGRYPVADFGLALLADFRAGRTVVEADATAEPGRSAAERAAFAAIGVRGHVTVPLIKDGSFLAGMAVQFPTPHPWPADEVALVEEVAERTWAAVERAKAEAAVRASEERLRLAAGAAGFGTYDVDLVAGRVHWDARMREILGVPPDLNADECLRAVPGSVHPDDRARVDALTRASREPGSPETVEDEHRVVRPGGEVRWVLLRGRTYFAGDGPDRRPARLTGVLLDVTARKRAEEAQRRGEERFRLVLENMPVLMDAFDPAGLVVAWNKECERVTGYAAAEVVGNPRAMAVLYPDPAYRERMLAEWAARGDDYQNWEWDLTAKDGTVRTVAWSNISGRLPIPGWASWGVGVDVTARKRAEDALRDADRRKDEFLALLAHELRNPLAPIRNGLQILRLAPAGSDKAARARDVMDRQLAHMVRLIDDLLDVSRITTGKMELRKGPTTLAEVVAAAVEAAGPVVEAAGHALAVSVPPDPVPLDADLTRLAQVVSNLLTNSAKYTPKGGRVWLTAARDGAEAVVTVRDTGLGLPAEFLPRLFDMFSQVDRGVEKATGGLGIGLALVRGLTEMHGGTVTAESPGPGKGSTFTVRLPAARNPEPGTRNGEPVKPAADGPSLRVPGSGFRVPRRVLVVDDNRDSAESMAEMLRLLGNEVAVAHDGLAAVEAAGRVRPDVVLMDIGMPKLNGLDATRRIRQHEWGAGMTILALTGWGQDDDRERSRAAGCDGHLVKPVGLADLEAAVAARRPGRNGTPASAEQPQPAAE